MRLAHAIDIIRTWRNFRQYYGHHERAYAYRCVLELLKMVKQGPMLDDGPDQMWIKGWDYDA